MIYKVEYTAGFGFNEHNHLGFGPTIYVEEIIDYESKKDYFDFVEFFLKYSKSDDTYFKIKLLNKDNLNEKEQLSYKKYQLLRDAMCEYAKQNTAIIEDDEIEKNYHQGD